MEVLGKAYMWQLYVARRSSVAGLRSSSLLQTLKTKNLQKHSNSGLSAWLATRADGLFKAL